MDDPAPRPLPRYLYVAASYDRHESTAYHLLVTSDEEHDPETDAGIAAIVRLLAQASERHDWFVSEVAFRAEVRATATRIHDETHDVVRYRLVAVTAGTGAWASETTGVAPDGGIAP